MSLWLTVIIIFIQAKCSIAYPLKCPDFSQIDFRRKYCRFNTTYVCLYDTETNTFKEFCKNETLQDTSPGQRYVWTNNIRNIRCRKDRYQPYGLLEHESSICVFNKFACQEEGQLVYDNKSTEEDRTCQCASTKGYEFVSVPNKANYCMPAEEDCSCYYAKNNAMTSGYTILTTKQITTPSLLMNNRTKEKTNNIPNKYDGKPIVRDRQGIGRILPLVLATIILAGLSMLIVSCFYETSCLNESSGLSMLIVSCFYETRCLNESSDIIHVASPVHAPTESTVDGNLSRTILVTTDNVGDLSSVISGKQKQETAWVNTVAGGTDNPSCETSILSVSNTNPVAGYAHIPPDPIPDDNLSNAIQDKTHHVNDSCSTSNQILRQTYFRMNAGGSNNLSYETPKRNVKSEPLLIICKDTFNGIAGNSITLQCYIKSPNCNLTVFQWSVINKTNHHITNLTIDQDKYSGASTENPSLTIHDLTPEDAGQYRCQISTDSGEEIIKSCTLEIKVEVPKIFCCKNRFTGIAGSSVTLECCAKSKFSELICIEWFYQKEPSDIKHYLEIDGIKYRGGTTKDQTITINQLASSDVGMYTCRATNRIGSNSSDGIPLDVIFEPPVVLTYQRSQTEFVGDDITLFCDVISHCTTQNLEWFVKKGKKEIKINTAENIAKYTGGTFQHPSLTIHNLHSNDAGIYRCQATNKSGTGSNKITVGVRGTAPIVITGSTMYTVDNEMKVTITFLIFAEPEPSEVFIDKNNNGIVTRITATGKTNINGLSIYYLETDEPGVYVCEAKNVMGCSRSQNVFVKSIRDFGNNITMVAALDIGTMYSKCAFSTIEAFNNDHMNICTSRMQNSGQKMLEPTCILLKKSNLEFVAFGYDAQKAYEQCINWDDTSYYLFFENFKTGLYRKEDDIDDIRIEEAGGEKLLAVDIFTAVIKALIDIVEQEMKDRKINIERDKILWVLTIPSIWFKKSKDFMIECCNKAGITESKVITILESKAASIYSASLPVADMSGLNESPLKINGTKYLMIDIGGTSCQISALYRIDDDEFRELCPSSVMPCAGKLLDLEILDILEKIVFDRVMDTLQQEEKTSYMDIVRQLESAKRISSAKVTSLSLTVPVDVFNKLCMRFIGKSFREALTDSGKADEIKLKHDKMLISESKMKSLFKKVVDNIISEIEKFLGGIKPTSINTFLLVGGFSNCRFVRNAIEERFSNCEVIRTDDSDFSIAKGAVLFGCKPNIVTTRITQFAYGRRLSPDFIEGRHDPDRRLKRSDGQDLCRDAFEIILDKNKFVPVGFKVNFTQSDHSIAIYVSHNETPLYIDEQGCKLLCKFDVFIDQNNQLNPTNTTHDIDVEMKFERTELMIKAVDRKHGDEDFRRFSLIV